MRSSITEGNPQGDIPHALVQDIPKELTGRVDSEEIACLGAICY